MPVLKNPRWERLAQELAANKTATEAMKAAGYSDPRNSTRLTKKDVIRARVEELQSRGAERAEVTVASLLDELEHARQRADGLDQLSAAVKAISEKAKISGLLVQRVEVGGVGEFEKCRTEAEVINLTVEGFVDEGYIIDNAARAQLVEMMERQVREHREFLATLPRAGFNYLNRPQTVSAPDSREPRKRLGSNGSAGNSG
jgi:hypothetical protein